MSGSLQARNKVKIMAKRVGKFLKGLVGGTVLKEYRGKQLLIIKPHFNPDHLTEGTKKAAKTFGSASIVAYWIRTALRAVITKFHDGTMNYRLNTAVLNCLNAAQDQESRSFQFDPESFNGLRGFEFNVGSPLKNNFFAQPVTSISANTLEVAFPQIQVPNDIKFPKGSTYVRLVIGAVMLDLVYGHVNLISLQSMDIQNNRAAPAPPRTFEFAVEPGCLCVTAISLQYFETTFAGDFIINSKTFNPAAVLSAGFAEGIVDPKQTKDWSEMDFSTFEPAP
jgi:hypothetical protein